MRGTRGVGAEVGEPALEIEVEHDVDQRAAQSLLQRVVAAVGRRIGVDVLGRDRRPDEDEAVMEIGAVEDLAGHRIEERLGAFGLLVIEQQADEMELDLLPQRVGGEGVEVGEPEFSEDQLRVFVHAAVVEVDPVASDVLNREPVARLEVALGRPGALAEERVVLVEALEQELRNCARLARAGSLMEGLRCRRGKR